MSTRWFAILLLALLPARSAVAGEVSKDLSVGGHVTLATLRLPDQVRPDMPIVLITHGTLAHKDMETIQGLSRALVERGIATLAHNLALGLDRRKGMYDCGVSHDYRPDEAIAEIDAWAAEARKTSSRLYLLGHSRGANQVARYLAARPDAPVKGAILLAPATAGVETALRAAYRDSYGQELDPLLQQANRAVADGRGGEWMKVPGFIYCKDAKVTARAFAAFYQPDPKQDTAALVAGLKLPTLVLAAAQDKTVPDVGPSFAPLAGQGGGRVRLETIDDADHFFLDLAAEDAADRIAKFIDE